MSDVNWRKGRGMSGMESSMLKLDIQGPTPTGKGVELGGVLQLMTCPYNESHRVGFGSYATHLFKCRSVLSLESQANYKICDYNETHHMLKEVYEDHLKVCADYRYFEAEKFDVPTTLFGNPEPREWMTKRDLKKKEEVAYTEKRDKARDDKLRSRGASEEEIISFRDRRHSVMLEEADAAEEDWINSF